jgi:hypothetical protein
MRSGLWVAEFGAGLRAATTPLTPTGRDWAALARVGPLAALSHLSAARIWGMDQRVPGQVWLTVPRRRNPRPISGLRIVRSRHLGADALRTVDGLPVLSPARTVADLAMIWDARRLTAAAVGAIQRGLCDLDDIRHWQQSMLGRPGSGDLAAAIDEADPAFESILAVEFGELVRGSGLTLVPGYKLRLPDGEHVICDFADPAARIDFEIDGIAFHSGHLQVARDKARDRRLSRAGWITVRYDTNDVRRYPRRTIEDARRQQAVRLAQFQLVRLDQPPN